ncbi:MAG: hypothetical protein Q4D51_01665 [Eubacteriales bacterium]|nr:hypothetical protein [Eubacteriales bacterium]
MAKDKMKLNKKSIIGIIIGAVISVIGIVITIITGVKKSKTRIKEHATKYKPI